ncbi:hypothetical protein PAXRUDRAFT_795375, partial [Paxillus rubicundulus Ve08.2h10]
MKEVEKLPLQAKMQVSSLAHSMETQITNIYFVVWCCMCREPQFPTAHFWQLIIKQWGNEYDNSVTYLHPTGVDIPCTPLMIWDWA